MELDTSQLLTHAPLARSPAAEVLARMGSKVMESDRRDCESDCKWPQGPGLWPPFPFLVSALTRKAPGSVTILSAGQAGKLLSPKTQSLNAKL